MYIITVCCISIHLFPLTNFEAVLEYLLFKCQNILFKNPAGGTPSGDRVKSSDTKTKKN